jgi:hypothetical protein
VMSSQLGTPGALDTLVHPPHPQAVLEGWVWMP